MSRGCSVDAGVSVMCTRTTRSRVKSLRAEQVVSEASSWPAIWTGLYTHVYACTHLHARGGAASTQALGAGEGSTVEPHRLHSATTTPFSTGTSHSRVTLYTHSQHDSGPSTAPPQAELCAPSQPRPLFTGHPPLLQRHTHDGAGAGVTRSTRTVRGSGSLRWERRGGIAVALFVLVAVWG